MFASPWGRLGVTVGLASVTQALFHIPIMGIDAHSVAALGGQLLNLSVGALGILPIINAFLIVEIGALLKSRWREIRVSGAQGRARMTRVARGVALVLAAAQSFGLCLYLEGISPWVAPAVSNPGWEFRATTMITLVGATALLMVIADAIGRFGVGNGYSVLIAVGICGQLWRTLGEALDHGPQALVKNVVVLLAIVFVVARLLPPRRPKQRTADGDPYRTASPKPPSPHPIVRPLPSGTLPLTDVAAVLIWISSIPVLLGDGEPTTALAVGAPSFEAWGAWLVVGLTLLFAVLFHSPRRIAELRAKVLGFEDAGAVVAKAKRRWVPQVIVAVLALTGAWWVQNWLWRTDELRVELLEGVVLAAVLLDIFHEMRARRLLNDAVVVGELHRIYALDVALALLEREGIQAAPRTVFHRTLLQFFGPYLPLQLLVPRQDAKRARKLLRRVTSRPRRRR